MLARLRHFRFDWKLTLLTVMLLPVLLSLGFWQLAREQEKRELQDLYMRRQSEQPVALGSLNVDEDLQYRQVELAGTWDADHVFLLDNRIYQGQVGYEVLMPLVSGDGVVFVNRGWIAQGLSREELPVIPAVAAVQTEVQGSVYVPVGDSIVLGEDLATTTWPRVIQTLDLPLMADMAGYDGNTLFPYSVRLAEGEPGVLVRYWPVITTTPEKHRAYAVQWFAMAAMLLGLYVYYSTRPLDAADTQS